MEMEKEFGMNECWLLVKYKIFFAKREYTNKLYSMSVRRSEGVSNNEVTGLVMGLNAQMKALSLRLKNDSIAYRHAHLQDILKFLQQQTNLFINVSSNNSLHMVMILKNTQTRRENLINHFQNLRDQNITNGIVDNICHSIDEYVGLFNIDNTCQIYGAEAFSRGSRGDLLRDQRAVPTRSYFDPYHVFDITQGNYSFC